MNVQRPDGQGNRVNIDQWVFGLQLLFPCWYFLQGDIDIFKQEKTSIEFYVFRMMYTDISLMPKTGH